MEDLMQDCDYPKEIEASVALKPGKRIGEEDVHGSLH
jgi:hypothetical protein